MAASRDHGDGHAIACKAAMGTTLRGNWLDYFITTATLEVLQITTGK